MTDAEPILATTIQPDAHFSDQEQVQEQDPKETSDFQERAETQVSESSEQYKNKAAQEAQSASENIQTLETQETLSGKQPEPQLETEDVVSHTGDEANDPVSAEITEQIRRMEAQFKRDVEKEIEMERQKAAAAAKESESNENDGNDKENTGDGSNDNAEKSSTVAASQIKSLSNSISKSSGSKETDKTKTSSTTTLSDKSPVPEPSNEPSNSVPETGQTASSSEKSTSSDRNSKTSEVNATFQPTSVDSTVKFALTSTSSSASSSSSSSTSSSSTSSSTGAVPASFVPSFAKTVSSTKYKGIEIPVNSVLVNSESSALLAYKNLLQNSQQSSTTTTTQNSRKGSIKATGSDENSDKTEKTDDKTDSTANANVDTIKDNTTPVTAFVTPNNNSNNHNPYRYQVSLVNAQLAALPLTITAPEYLSLNIQLLINTLPVLDNLATQILRIIAQGPYQKVMELVANTESYTSIAFGNLVELFETTKRMYNSEESPFFTVENATFGLWKYRSPAPAFLRGREETIEGTLRKVNLATFLLTALGVIDLGFFFLNAAFLDVFCPPQNLDPNFSISNLAVLNELGNSGKANNGINGISGYQFQNLSKGGGTLNQTKFLKSQAILFLELKTQAFISAIELGDKSKAEIIQDLFPDNLDEVLLKRKDPDFDPLKKPIQRNSTMFTPAELDFLTRCESRKENLLKFDAEVDSSLMEKYEWIKFLNDLLDYVSKNVGFLVWGPKGKIAQELARLQLNESTFSDGSADEQGKRKAEGEATPPPRKMVRHNRPGTFRRTWTEQEENALREGLKQKGTQWSAILSIKKLEDLLYEKQIGGS
ncbi:unnamed protein product [Ambrosiozyma monospora]|uniref:Unnamed protein product n=1 Tax=Ambrosiozyma monospora TaxID=43982 RepID=A0ACB5SX91_AMBMO|nr:unnamed protein product [Ambrosiozyma monospora]